MKTTGGGVEVEIKAGGDRSLLAAPEELLLPLESFIELQGQKKANGTGCTGRKAELVASGASYSL